LLLQCGHFFLWPRPLGFISKWSTIYIFDYCILPHERRGRYCGLCMVCLHLYRFLLNTLWTVSFSFPFPILCVDLNWWRDTSKYFWWSTKIIYHHQRAILLLITLKPRRINLIGFKFVENLKWSLEATFGWEKMKICLSAILGTANYIQLLYRPGVNLHVLLIGQWNLVHYTNIFFQIHNFSQLTSGF
jgi:hypothetical protein